jgi:hypothetical protein
MNWSQAELQWLDWLQVAAKKLGGVSLSWASIIRVDHVSTRPMKPFFFFPCLNLSVSFTDRYRQTYLDMYLEFKRYHSTLAALTLIIVFRSVENFTPKTIIPRTKFCEGKYWIFGNIFIFIKWEMRNELITQQTYVEVAKVLWFREGQE